MSYILDALKKSEEERKKGDVPGLQTYTPTTKVSSGKKTWVIGVVALIATNIIGLLLWAPWRSSNSLVEKRAEPPLAPMVSHKVLPQTPSRQVQPSIQATSIPVQPSKKEVISKPISIKPAATAEPNKPIAKLPITQREETRVNIPKPPSQHEYRPKTPPSTAYLPQLSELPESIQNQIPDLTFSSHMYSSQDKFRSITINGKRLKQGRYYNEQLYVNEITEKGAVMGFDGTLFEVDVLGQWGN